MIQKVVISTHTWATGFPESELKKYLNQKQISQLLWIGHPLTYHPRLNGSSFELYHHGQLSKSSYRKIVKIPSLLAYIKDIWLNIWYVWKTKETYDYYIGIDNLNAFSGWILKKLGKTKYCIYYVIDFTPKRFENKLINKLYHALETFCAKHCDETWNLSHTLIEGRQKFKGVSPYCGIQRVVPMGIWFHEVKRVEFAAVQKQQLVFMGHILEKQGIQYVLDAIPLIIKKIPDFNFLVIGEGEYLSDLKSKAQRLDIESYVDFKGYVEKHEELEYLIASSAVAIAPYQEGDYERNFTYYTDSGKIKTYLGAGVPVLLTKVPHNAETLQNLQCGKVITLDSQSIANAVCELLINEAKLLTYRNNALNYAKQFDWQIVFDNAFFGNS